MHALWSFLLTRRFDRPHAWRGEVASHEAGTVLQADLVTFLVGVCAGGTGDLHALLVQPLDASGWATPAYFQVRREHPRG